ncbi:MAG: SidA/IucD/PvdA family monooxygenase, partial [Geminicoccaceae bacterium]
PNTDINNGVFRDLATPRNPRSRYTFANYLRENGRLYSFGLLGRPPSRLEWSLYVEWVASHFVDSVAYNQPVTSLRPVIDNDRLSAIEVETPTATYRTVRLVLSTGSVPSIPSKFRGLLGDRVFHTADFLSRLEALLDNKTLRALVVGSGQSAAEAVLEINARLPQAKIYSLHRSIGFRLADIGHFSQALVFSPEETDYFFGLPEATKQAAFDATRRTNFSGLDMEESGALYSLIYEDALESRNRIEIMRRQQIYDISDVDGTYRVTCRDIYSGSTRTIEVDCIILGTGYHQETFPSLLQNLTPFLEFDANGGVVVSRDYRAQTRDDARAELYLSGLCERSHGMSDAQSFSLVAVRAQRLLEALLSDQARHIPIKAAALRA